MIVWIPLINHGVAGLNREDIGHVGMIHTSSRDQSFVDVGEDVTTQFSRLHYRTPSDSDSELTTMVVSRSEASTVDGPPSRLSSVGGRRYSGRRRTLNDGACTSSSVADNSGCCLIDACCTVVPTKSMSGTNLTTLPGDDEQDHSDNIRTATTEDFDNASSSKCGSDRMYENVQPAIIRSDFLTVDDCDSSRSNLSPEVMSSSSVASQAPPMRLLFPGDGVARKASSSSSTSSVCDSVLELCTVSSRCSSCSEATAAAAAATPVWDAPSLPDSGNGSSDAGVEHFRFSRLLSSDLGNPSDRVRFPGGTSSASYSLVANFLPAWDAERLETVYGRLAQSGFYYGRLTVDAASERLRQAAVGAFLLRDSTDDRYLFSISVQTCRGSTSIRMIYHAGLFRLDCSPEQEHLMPTFDCALRLIAHYVRICCSRRTSGSSYVFLESSGRRDTPVLLRRPLYRRVDRLTHLCRRAVHRALSWRPSDSESDRGGLVDRLQLVPSLKCYLKDYPYEL